MSGVSARRHHCLSVERRSQTTCFDPQLPLQLQSAFYVLQTSSDGALLQSIPTTMNLMQATLKKPSNSSASMTS